MYHGNFVLKLFWRMYYMKKFSILLVSAAVFTFFSMHEASATSQFGNLLIQLETSVKFSAQSSNWRSRRSGWIRRVRSCSNVSCMKALLKEFETNINYSAQSSSWRSSRSSWLRSVNQARSQGQLANTLLTVESSIKYSAQSDSWRSRRSSWRTQVRNLR